MRDVHGTIADIEKVLAESAHWSAAHPAPDQAPPAEPDALAPDPDPAGAPAADGVDPADGVDTAADDGEPDSAEPGPAKRGGRGGRVAGRAATGMAVVGALVGAYGGWSWYGAAHDDGLAYSRTRDQVLRAGEQEVQNLNTLDYRDFSGGMRLWTSSATGTLLAQITQGRTAFQQKVATARTVTTARVLEGAVTQLDERAGKAEIIVALEIRVAPVSGQPETKQSRLIGELTRTAAGWRMSDLGQAPAGTSGS